ncbi:hypothetical protein GF382_00320 [Candidatus Falkowbacteria bacterium]|nr:hypothetical protein [Candidatus Falkowbacteria bacterium]
MKNQEQAQSLYTPPEKIAKRLRSIARTVLFILALSALVFSLFSGIEEAGGGISGLINNGPNALPWLILFIFVFVAWKWELLGGFLIVAMGVFSIFFFDTFNRDSWPILFIVSLPLLLSGGFLIGAWGLTKKNGNS